MAIITLLLDQLSKWFFITELGISDRPPIELLPFFNLVMVWNYGISFGMLASHRLPLILITLTGFIVLLLFIWMWRVPSKLIACALGGIIGGAVGNIIDRLRFDAVADFFDFHVGLWHWPAFNIADSAIFIGVVLLCVHSMFMEDRTPRGQS